MEKIQKYVTELFNTYTEFKKMGEFEIVKFNFIDDKLEVSYQRPGKPEKLPFDIFIPKSFIDTFNTTHKI